MKKHIMLTLFYFVLLQVDCCSYPGEIKNGDLFIEFFSESPRFTNINNEHLENVRGYFENQIEILDKNIGDPLREIDMIFSFSVFSRKFLQEYTGANNNYNFIILKFVKNSYDEIINSKDNYVNQNPVFFNLAQDLVPVYQHYYDLSGIQNN